MPTSTVNSISMADIGSINGQTIPAGQSGGGGYAVSSTGLLIWGHDGAPLKPVPADQFVGGSIPHSYKVFDPAPYTVAHIDNTNNYMGILDSNGTLFTGGGSNTAYMGRSTSGSTPASGFYSSLTGVATFCAHQYGFFAVKTDGTLWHTGQTNQFLSSESATYYTWDQVGTDTDWIAVESTNGYPYAVYAIKGSGSSRHIYAAGYNAYGATGQGTTSGRLYAWTRVKSAAATDLAEDCVQIASSARGTAGVVTSSGKIFTWGDGFYGLTGTGSNAQATYAAQVGTATNWTKLYFGALAGFAINSSNEIYASSSNANYYKFTVGQITNTRTYQKVGTHTDIADIKTLTYSPQTSSNWAGVLIKKTDGKWYYNGGNGYGQFGPVSGTATAGGTIDGDFTSATYVTNPISSSATQGIAHVTSNEESVTSVPGIMIAVS